MRDFYVAALDRPATNNMPNFVEFMRDTQAIQPVWWWARATGNSC